MGPPRLALIPLASIAAAFAFAGCGEIDSGTLEEEIADDNDLGAVEIDSVSCPDGEESETGNTFECTIQTATDDEVTVDVVDKDGANGDVVYLPDRKARLAATAAATQQQN